MSDGGRERGEAAWLKGDVSLSFFFFFFFTYLYPDGIFMYFMFAWERRLNRFTGKGYWGVAVDQKDWNSIINSDSLFLYLGY